MKAVIIIGGQAGAKICYDIFNLHNIKVLGFMTNFVRPGDWAGIPATLLGEYEETKNLKLLKKPQIHYIVATGDNALRKKHTEQLMKSTGKPPLNAIHPNAIISKFAKIGFGNLISPGAIINVGASIGNGTIINTGTIIEHDVQIADFAQISPNATLTGYVKVDEQAFIASSASVIPHVTIGARSVVGAGAIVMHDVLPDVLVAGCPAVIKKRFTKK